MIWPIIFNFNIFGQNSNFENYIQNIRYKNKNHFLSINNFFLFSKFKIINQLLKYIIIGWITT